MASGKWELERIITHEFPLNELEQAIRTASNVDHANTSTLANEVKVIFWRLERRWLQLNTSKLIGYYEKHEYRNVETMKQYDLW